MLLHQILNQIYELCQKHHIEFKIVTLTESEKTTQTFYYCKHQNIPIFDISLPLPSEKYSHLPYDIHPNAVAHQHFAKEMIRFLKRDFEL